jgi:hypothetical protein
MRRHHHDARTGADTGLLIVYTPDNGARFLRACMSYSGSLPRVGPHWTVSGLVVVRGRKEAAMYIGGVALLVFVFAVLMAFGVIPFTALVVGLLIAALCVGVAGPVFIK